MKKIAITSIITVSSKFFTCFGLIVLLLGLLLGSSVKAAVLQPNVFFDETDGECTFDCSLRDAVIIANGNNQSDLILLDSGIYYLTIVGLDDVGVVGDLDIFQDHVTVVGQGETETFIDATAVEGAFEVHGSASLDISGVTILYPDSDPDILVSPPACDFGEIQIGDTDTTTVTIVNLGGGPLTVTDISFQTNSGDFYIISAPTLPTTLDPVTDTLDVQIAFSPSVPGSLSASLEVSSDDPDEPLVVVELSGTGIEQAPTELNADLSRWHFVIDKMTNNSRSSSLRLNVEGLPEEFSSPERGFMYEGCTIQIVIPGAGVAGGDLVLTDTFDLEVTIQGPSLFKLDIVE